MGYVRGLSCRECGTAYEQGPVPVCEQCFGPLEVQYDYDAIRADLSRQTIEARPANLWRYRELLPIDGEPAIGLHSGFTPLVRAAGLATALGVEDLWIKDDSVNHPTCGTLLPRGRSPSMPDWPISTACIATCTLPESRKD